MVAKSAERLARGDEAGTALVLLCVAVCLVAAHGGRAGIVLPPARLLLELGVANAVAITANAAAGTVAFLLPRATPLVHR